MVYRNTTGKTLYVNADKSKVVEEGSPEAAFVLCGPGAEMPDAEAAKYGLGAHAKHPAKAEPPELKTVGSFVSKAVAPKENK